MDFNWTSVVLMLFGTVFGFIGYQYKEIHGRLKEDIEKNKQAVVKLEDRGYADQIPERIRIAG